MTQENIQGNYFTNAKHFWNRQTSFVKHLLGLILAFIGLPVIIVLTKLGFRELATILMLMEALLVWWATGLLFLFGTVIKLCLQGMTIIP
jgi:hypothetical protein